ncbi:hypothetical protein ODV42_004357 [Salmonella enterica]|nr:hypothetical protein [Salmonella enterica]EGM7046999.1 hypothetical protein [Salmonella enterica subsp. enterica serovar Oslo]EGR6835614.1 hypothetical protein [Salmonella enterica]EHA5623629.1 hypothetical protein [Salmonella enterica]EHB3615657.1 hypothetical protein [Salmonella enterica]
MFPAPAGINRINIRHLFTINSVPRASGDKPDDVTGADVLDTCSPRQRG